MAYGTDTFTDTTDTLLTAHTPELGGPWVAHPNTAVQWVISNDNRARLQTANTGIAYMDGAVPASPDYDVTATLHYFTNSGSVYAIAGRMSTSADTAYLFRRTVAANQWQISKVVAGTVTALATSSAVVLSAGTDYEMTLRMVGDQITALVDGAVVAGPVTDTSITTAGRAGFRSSGSGGAVGNVTGMHFGDFEIAVGAQPSNTVPPVVSGTPTVGETLTTTDGTWTNSPTSFAYQWQRDEVDISGATASTYDLVADDFGHDVQAVVTASNASGPSAGVPSNALSVSGDITATDVKFFTASAGGLGGAPGVAIASPSTVWDPVTADEAGAGRIEYRAVYLKNTHPATTLTGVKVWVESQTTSPTTSVSIGVAPQAAGVNVTSIENETTAPASVSFSAPTDVGSGLTVGDLGPGQARGIWQRWSVSAGTAELSSDSFTLGWDGAPA